MQGGGGSSDAGVCVSCRYFFLVNYLRESVCVCVRQAGNNGKLATSCGTDTSRQLKIQIQLHLQLQTAKDTDTSTGYSTRQMTSAYLLRSVIVRKRVNTKSRSVNQ